MVPSVFRLPSAPVPSWKLSWALLPAMVPVFAPSFLAVVQAVVMLRIAAASPRAKIFQDKLADEILPAIRKYALWETILSNPAELANLLGIKNFEPDKKCAYVMEMENGTVKIGVTQDFDRRINEVINNSGMEVVRHFHTEKLDKAEAFRAEHACHKTFAKTRKRGEFFDVNFDNACVELQSHVTDSSGENFAPPMIEKLNFEGDDE